MNFEHINNTTSGNIFLVNLSDLDGYLSPLFYKSKPTPIPHARRLKDIAIVNPTRPRPKFEPDELVPYVGLPETDEHSHEIIEVVMRPYKEVAGRSVIYPNDILFARIEPSVFNKKYIEVNDLHGHPFAFTSTEFYVVENPSIDAQYLFFMFLTDYVYNQVKGKTTGSTGRRRLDPDIFAKLLIPVPTSSKIKEVVQIICDARKLRVIKLDQAKVHFDSIDDYLLSELGYDRVERNHCISNRIFTVPFSKSTGNRFDPLFFYQNFLDELPNGKYAVEYLGKHVKHMITGFAAGKGNQSFNPGDPIQIRPTNISDRREFQFERNIYIPSSEIESRKSDLCQSGEVLFNNTNSQDLVGKSVLFNLKGNYFCSNHMTRIGTKQSLNPSFLNHILNLYQRQQVFYKLCTNWNNQSGVNVQVLNQLPIPLPAPDVQANIAKKIDHRRFEAQRLEQEANAILEKARQQVEEMILKP